ncbi:Lypd9 [Phodopus roborovskii]|uniref:Lypd9 protein n=1 Tax=Phodopus roborovskii TaxID=109678 RepID=A0AAU9Z0Q1_PHORO|nr:Lypd9 [Phodopus roborovskii]
MHPAAPSRLLLACSLAFMPFSTVSWEITMSDLEEKVVDEFSSNGLKCPTCFSVRYRECSPVLRWCSPDKINCMEFSGIVVTGVTKIAIEVKKCITTDLCKDTVTAYMGFPVINESMHCKPAVRNGARARPPTPFFFVLFLKKLLH